MMEMRICGAHMGIREYVRIYFICVVFLMPACSYFVSWDETSRSAIGLSIDEVIKMDGPPDAVVPMNNGNKEYRYWLKSIDPTCIHYWIVNPQGIITGYHYEGRCRPIG